mmetsp:Transcript_9585/g.21014  ORF Transcript_9585/g.21014 Transcript_9585/m.21014 type:complete len:274 (+) Transcript_9585:347-1168(+)
MGAVLCVCHLHAALPPARQRHRSVLPQGQAPQLLRGLRTHQGQRQREKRLLQGTHERRAAYCLQAGPLHVGAETGLRAQGAGEMGGRKDVEFRLPDGAEHASGPVLQRPVPVPSIPLGAIGLRISHNRPPEPPVVPGPLQAYGRIKPRPPQGVLGSLQHLRGQHHLGHPRLHVRLPLLHHGGSGAALPGAAAALRSSAQGDAERAFRRPRPPVLLRTPLLQAQHHAAVRGQGANTRVVYHPRYVQKRQQLLAGLYAGGGGGGGCGATPLGSHA